jgi:hypothetical protein
MLFDDRNDVLHADLASLARYVVTIIRGMVIDAMQPIRRISVPWLWIGQLQMLRSSSWPSK